MNKQTPVRSAFTLVELLVVIAIIALLLAVLLPAVGAVKTRAKVAATSSYFNGIATGIESYRAEQSLGASLPPSATDAGGPPNGGTIQQMADPAKTASDLLEVAGAHLLVMALRGADGLGCPGFKPVRTAVDGWWNDTFNGGNDCAEGGLYCVATTGPTAGKEKFPRYGPYVDEKLSERAKSIKGLAEKGRILNPTDAGDTANSNLEFFTDAWDLPILYYKASPASNSIVGSGTTRGIYRQEDNGLITGTRGGLAQATWKGLDFGSGTLAEADPLGDAYHILADATAPTVGLTEVPQFLENSPKTFARYIVDPKIKTRITPVQKDSYLLISTGPDGIYGTSDDITNWTRETN